MVLKDNKGEIDRIPTSPPVITLVPNHIKRPLWSVMIPAYNCFKYLQEAMESVLIQDLGSEVMQIAVVDDCSTDGDVEALVKTIGRGRIDYIRHQKNLGSLRSFETCLNRSTGEWIHILHGDDRVVNGFYQEICALFRQYPDAGAAFTNIATIIENKLYVDTPLAAKPQIIEDFLIQMAQSVKVQPPAMVVKRSVYEKLGGFYAVHYGEDWEMWTRIAAYFPVAYSPKCLAHYRYLNLNSITHHSIRNGNNILDVIKVLNIIQQYLPVEKRKQLKKNALKNYSLYCISLARQLYPTDPISAFVQLKGALRMSANRAVISSVIKFVLNIWPVSKNIKIIKKIYEKKS